MDTKTIISIVEIYSTIGWLYGVRDWLLVMDRKVVLG